MDSPEEFHHQRLSPEQEESYEKLIQLYEGRRRPLTKRQWLDLASYFQALHKSDFLGHDTSYPESLGPDIPE